MAAPQFGQLRVAAFIAFRGRGTAGRVKLNIAETGLTGKNSRAPAASEMNDIGAGMNEIEA